MLMAVILKTEGKLFMHETAKPEIMQESNSKPLSSMGTKTGLRVF